MDDGNCGKGLGGGICLRRRPSKFLQDGDGYGTGLSGPTKIHPVARYLSTSRPAAATLRLGRAVTAGKFTALPAL